MPALEQRPIVIRSGDQERPGLLHLNTYTPRERMLRAAKVWGLSWLLAVLSIPIVIAHWVLVPGFFIAGPIWAYKRYSMTSAPDHVSGQCPSNGEQITLALEPSDRLPLWTHCPACKASLQLLEQGAAAPVALVPRPS